MSYSLTWLPGVLDAAGLQVAPQKGWEDRGRGDVGRIQGVICHHTAVAAGGNMPALHALINGRAAGPGVTALAGPLAQLGLGRDGTFYVIAAGRCNHAGEGQWLGFTNGNANFIGIEAQNDGKGEAWPEVQMEAYWRGVAAILMHEGLPVNRCAGHKEYAPHRKPDPSFRHARVPPARGRGHGRHRPGAGTDPCRGTAAAPRCATRPRHLAPGRVRRTGFRLAAHAGDRCRRRVRRHHRGRAACLAAQP